MDLRRNIRYAFRFHLLLGDETDRHRRKQFVILVVALAGGIGCALACLVSDKLSKDRTYVNVIMSDDLDAMQKLRDFLAEHHITNVASDSYTRDWNTKTITITAYPDTKAESRLISSYIASSLAKFKRLIQPGF